VNRPHADVFDRSARCDGCVFWRRIGPDPESVDGTAKGRCVVDGPRAVLAERRTLVSFWPETQAGADCGRYSPMSPALKTRQQATETATG